VTSLVRPELGPSLPAVIRGLPRWALLGLGALALLFVLGLAGVAALRDNVTTATVVVTERPAFNLIWRENQLRRVAPGPGERLRLQTPTGSDAPQRFVVRALQLPSYRGEAGGELPLFAAGLSDDLRAVLPGYQPRGEGRTRVNELPGYQIVFQTKLAGRTAYGKRVLLLPDDGAQPGDRVG